MGCQIPPQGQCSRDSKTRTFGCGSALPGSAAPSEGRCRRCDGGSPDWSPAGEMAPCVESCVAAAAPGAAAGQRARAASRTCGASRRGLGGPRRLLRLSEPPGVGPAPPILAASCWFRYCGQRRAAGGGGGRGDALRRDEIPSSTVERITAHCLMRQTPRSDQASSTTGSLELQEGSVNRSGCGGEEREWEGAARTAMEGFTVSSGRKRSSPAPSRLIPFIRASAALYCSLLGRT